MRSIEDIASELGFNLRVGVDDYKDAKALADILTEEGHVKLEIDYLHWGEDGTTWTVVQKSFRWKLVKTQNGERSESTYGSIVGIPVSRYHVLGSPQVKAWLGPDHLISCDPI